MEMADYIELKTAIEFVKKYAPTIDGMTTLGCVERALYNAPNADVTEVVRCKDCAVPHNKWLGCPKLRGLVPPPDFYCAFGERKDKNG